MFNGCGMYSVIILSSRDVNGTLMLYEEVHTCNHDPTPHCIHQGRVYAHSLSTNLTPHAPLTLFYSVPQAVHVRRAVELGCMSSLQFLCPNSRKTNLIQLPRIHSCVENIKNWKSHQEKASSWKVYLKVLSTGTTETVTTWRGVMLYMKFYILRLHCNNCRFQAATYLW